MDDLLFGLSTTALGMGIVFGLLALLWALLTLVTKLDAWGAARAETSAAVPAEAPVPAGSPGPTSTAVAELDGGRAVTITGSPDTTDSLDPRLVAAITVAILRHEEARRLQAAPAMRSYWPGSLLFASRWVAAGRTRQGQSWRRRR